MQRHRASSVGSYEKVSMCCWKKCINMIINQWIINHQSVSGQKPTYPKYFNIRFDTINNFKISSLFLTVVAFFVLTSPNTSSKIKCNCAFHIITLIINDSGFVNVRGQLVSKIIECKVFDTDLRFGAKVSIVVSILSDRSATR